MNIHSARASGLLMLILIAVVLSQSAVAPECKTSGSSTACGYSCLAGLGVVKCAQTPQGFCRNVERSVVCWDPPEEVRLHPPKDDAVECKVKNGSEPVCGYACATSESKAACAQTPWGVCTSRNDDVFCWDPASVVIHHWAGRLRRPMCLSSDSEFACGFSCKQVRQSVKCAQTPEGTCQIINGAIVCFDPPLPPISHEPVAKQAR